MINLIREIAKNPDHFRSPPFKGASLQELAIICRIAQKIEKKATEFSPELIRAAEKIRKKRGTKEFCSVLARQINASHIT